MCVDVHEVGKKKGKGLARQEVLIFVKTVNSGIAYFNLQNNFIA